MFKTKMTAAALAASFFVVPSAAQEDMKPKKRNAEYYSVLFLDFKPGKMDEAEAIIDDYFARADEDAELEGPTMNLVFMTGDWDMMVAWRMEDGLSDGEWEVSPNDVAWMEAMGRLAGGSKGAQAKLDEFSDLVEHSHYQMAYAPL